MLWNNLIVYSSKARFYIRVSTITYVLNITGNKLQREDVHKYKGRIKILCGENFIFHIKNFVGNGY